MPFKLKDGAVTDGLPTITLAGEDYFIARLPLDHRIEVQLLVPTLRKITERFRAATGIGDGDSPEAIKQKLQDAAGATFDLDRADYDAFIDVASHGLLPLYPQATRAALLAEPIDFEELFAAWPVVVSQGASRRPAAPGEA